MHDIDTLPEQVARAVENQSAFDYAAADAVRSSALKQLLLTPAHYQHYLHHPKAETPAMTKGTALHAALLEPETFAEQFAVVPKVDRRRKQGRQQWQEYTEAHAGKVLLQATDLALIERLRAAIAGHERARALLTLPGHPELSLYWADPITGIRLKARPDRLLAEPRRVLVEIKTTAKADKFHFQKRIVDFDYHLSLAMYREGVKALFGEAPPAVFLVVEDETFQVCLYKPDEDMLLIGYKRFRTAVELLARCLETNQWPGYQPHSRIEEISLPRWALTQVDPYGA